MQLDANARALCGQMYAKCTLLLNIFMKILFYNGDVLLGQKYKQTDKYLIRFIILIAKFHIP